ncbi:MAG TPA: hypothetical protein EYG51_22255 [Pseudomonadales bacterium]|nr:hypothetical protein [Pseudomonadales bacterium]
MKPQWTGLDQQHPHGALIEFVCAPPRYKGEPPREPAGLLGRTGMIVDGPVSDGHCWGGMFNVLVAGKMIHYYGDFMKVIS